MQVTLDHFHPTKRSLPLSPIKERKTKTFGKVLFPLMKKPIKKVTDQQFDRLSQKCVCNLRNYSYFGCELGAEDKLISQCLWVPVECSSEICPRWHIKTMSQERLHTILVLRFCLRKRLMNLT